MNILVNDEHKTFLKGRSPLVFDEEELEHPLNMEWYEEQIYRSIKGYTHKGYTITGDHYFMINFVPIQRAILDLHGSPTDKFEVEYPLWTQTDDWIFKQLQEAKQDKKDFMMMTARGTLKTYIAISQALKMYVVYPNSHSLICAATLGLAKQNFNDKLIPSLNELEKRHPTLRQKRIRDTEKEIISGEIFDTGRIKETRGRQSKIERIIFNTEGVTAGRRVDFTVFDEIGEFSNNPSLKDCINNTMGTAKVGSIKRGFTMYIGTGGSVSSDQAKDIFFNPEAYNLYIPKEYEKKTAVFIPVYKKYGGFYEKTGYSDEEGAKLEVERVRQEKSSDAQALNKFVQQYPMTADEVFMKNNSKIFNSLDLATQYVNITHKVVELPKIDRGYLDWETMPDGKKIVKFIPDINGKLLILQHPDKSSSKETFKNLYTMGVDSIDMGNNDSTQKDGKGRSKLAAMVKKRINPEDAVYGLHNNTYVAVYLDRADDIEDNYDDVLKLSLYYDAKVMLEYTRTRIVSYFQRYKAFDRLCQRPAIARSTFEESTTLIGYQVNDKILNHCIGLVKDYLRSYATNIWFEDLLKQLIDYTDEEKGKFDLVAAMFACELHDEQLSNDHVIARPVNANKIQNIGWFINQAGYREFGVLPTKEFEPTQKFIDYYDDRIKGGIVYRNIPLTPEDYINQKDYYKDLKIKEKQL
jgi:hypothetical protein